MSLHNTDDDTAPNPEQLLSEARQYAKQAETAWNSRDLRSIGLGSDSWNDRRAGEHALAALRCYMDLDALITNKKMDLPEQWRPEATPYEQTEGREPSAEERADDRRYFGLEKGESAT